MRVGTRSVLFGAHQFLLHPLLLAWAWWRLFGFPWDPRLWVAFFVRDLGYIGKPNMDGPEGEQHPYFGARVMRIFGEEWYYFSLLHSRYLAKALGLPPSRLCVADKYVLAYEPAWLYLPRVRFTGEIVEYMARAKIRAADHDRMTDVEKRLATASSEREWYAGVQAYMRRWVEEHRDGRDDTWTSGDRHPLGNVGVTQ